MSATARKEYEFQQKLLQEKYDHVKNFRDVEDYIKKQWKVVAITETHLFQKYTCFMFCYNHSFAHIVSDKDKCQK